MPNVKTLKLIILLSMLCANTVALAHGNHHSISPDHGLAHMLLYGGGLIVAYLAWRAARHTFRRDS